MILSTLIHPYVPDYLNRGDLAVLMTDTIYGIVAQAASESAVERLYVARQRNRAKSCIILVADIGDIPNLSENHQKTYLQLSSKQPTTIIVPAPKDYLPHLVRQQHTLAFRLVPPSDLANLIHQTGPLIAPSANTEGMPPATTIEEAAAYFGDNVAIYVDGGPAINATPSKIIAINDSDDIEVIRD